MFFCRQVFAGILSLCGVTPVLSYEYDVAPILQGFKVAKRSKFLARHIDQVWEDVRAETPVHDGKAGVPTLRVLCA